MGDRYDDVELPWPDTQLAMFLCIGGPCKYKIKKDSGIDYSFILRVIMKDVREIYNDDVCDVLGYAIFITCLHQMGEILYLLF